MMVWVGGKRSGTHWHGGEEGCGVAGHLVVVVMVVVVEGLTTRASSSLLLASASSPLSSSISPRREVLVASLASHSWEMLR